ncbi:MAG: M48 family peptidase [Bacteroidetes bacterium]|nr:MAG: M48 family peptidase [Bacteroidota bacterium]RLD83720.1 MAG: M48 family peptidase [Bacteroidota bacterium]
MKKVLIGFLGLLFLYSCSTVAISNRKQIKLIPNSSMFATSFQQYDGFLKENKLSTNRQKSQMVKNVGLKIQKAVEKYFAEKGMSSSLKGYNWEFNLVEDPQVNAWCMPGGKVVVYSGILPATKDETGLAVVMGHEIAHAIADHGNERMSQQLVLQMGGTALSTALESKPEETKALWMTTFGVGAQFGAVLPFSRLHESEADHLGLIFMAMAGYNPNEAVDFWTRMSKMGGQKPPEFMSTHPSDETRIKQIKEHLPEAMTYYKK